MCTYLVCSFYLLTPIHHPQEEVQRWRAFFSSSDIKGRIYLSKDGVNAQVSLPEREWENLSRWLWSDPRFASVDIKTQRCSTHAFPRMTVKHRDLVSLGEEVDLSDRGESLPAHLWKDRLAGRDAQTLVLDVRNDYEWEVGHFEGAMRPDCKTFKDFPLMARKLKEEYSPQATQLLIYCTGGIRCEWYAPLLKREGFDHIYRLEGGLLKYGSEVGTAHWKGKVFVFDDRLVVPICEEEKTEVVGKCCHCGETTESCYNCANMSCNKLFLSCLRCSIRLEGCCSPHCCSAPRKREFVPTERPKPFRRLSQEERGRLISK